MHLNDDINCFVNGNARFYLKVNGVSITNPTVLSNQFNNHFATIVPELASNIDSSNSDGYQKYLTGTDNGLSSIRPVQIRFSHF